MNKINIRLYDTFGCTLVSTVLLQSLRKKFPATEIIVYTKNPDLISGLKEVDKIIDAKSHSLVKYDIDLTDYLEIYKPQENLPLRHLSEHMLEIAENQLGIGGQLERGFLPKINLSSEEIEEGKKIVSRISKGKPVIWLQTKSRKKEKEYDQEKWKEIIKEKSDEYTFIDLSEEKYTKRMSISIAKACFAGITLDTFLLHGSKAVDSRNVIVILVSTHPEVVSYKDQIILNGTKDLNLISVQSVINHLNNIVAQF